MINTQVAKITHVYMKIAHFTSLYSIAGYLLRFKRKSAFVMLVHVRQHKIEYLQSSPLTGIGGSSLTGYHNEQR